MESIRYSLAPEDNLLPPRPACGIPATPVSSKTVSSARTYQEIKV